MPLSYSRTIVKSLFGCDDTHLPVKLFCHKNHTLRLDTTDLAWCEVGEDTDLFPDFIIASPKLEFQPIIGFDEV